MSHKNQGALLEIRQLVKSFNGFRALDGISFSLARGEILGLVGPNGSGKTTCINVISGLYKANSGDVLYQGQSINGKPMHYMCEVGVNRTFQVPKPFKALTVTQNIEIAKSRKTSSRAVIEDVLSFVGLKEFATREAGSLTSGQQKMLDLARALATNPELLLVDELAAGLSPSELDDVADKLKQLANCGIAMVVVEHLLSFVNQLTKRVIVMNAGKEIFEGDLESASKDEQVVAVYLGH